LAAAPAPAVVAQVQREADLAADEEDMDSLLKSRGGRRKKK
jgi:hypothetical protein